MMKFLLKLIPKNCKRRKNLAAENLKSLMKIKKIWYIKLLTRAKNKEKKALKKKSTFKVWKVFKS